MKSLLLYEHDGDNSLRKKVLNENELIQDLNLGIIFEAMAQNDPFLYNAARTVILNSITSSGTILYRQDILKDCMEYRHVICNIYSIASATLKDVDYYIEFNQPNYARIVPASERVEKSLGLLELLIARLEDLKAAYRPAERAFKSKGLSSFCSRQAELLTVEFFRKVKEHISDLKLICKGGRIVIGSSIGKGMKGDRHVLRKISDSCGAAGSKKGFLKFACSNVIPLDNTSIANSAREIADAGLIHILRVINQFTNNIVHFLKELRLETGFYTGCINLYNLLLETGVPVCFPVPEEAGKETLVFEGLYDLSMAIAEQKKLVDNDLDAAGKNLFIITGANQGGKSTFLRSIGLAQLLMQCGMFVPASSFSANICDHIFTHFTREEDASMNSGKLDEELSRINHIINHITPGSLLLMNESFATTTERDASKIAGDIIAALYELNVKVMFVTHLFEFADNMYRSMLEKSVFLRAGRNDDGSRPFRISLGKPLQTSYGEDLYNSIIASAV